MTKALPILIWFGFGCSTLMTAQLTIDDYYVEGSDLLKANRYEEAVTQFTLGLDQCAKLGDESYEKCIAMRFNRAMAYNALNEPVQANRDLDFYFENAQNIAIGDYELQGEVKLAMNDYAGAVSAFSKEIERMGEVNVVYVGRAKANFRRRYLQEARQDIDTYLSTNPNDFEANLLKGDIEYFEAMYGVARNYYEEALRQNSESIQALNNIANTYKEEGDCNQALYYYGRAIQKYPKNPSGYCNRALCLMKFRYYDKAEQDLAEARRISKDLEFTNYISGKLHLIRGEYKSALEDFEEALLENPRFVDAYIGKIEAYVKMKQYDNALIQLRKAMEMDKQNPAIKSLLGYLRVKKGDIQAGLDLLDDIINDIPNYSPALCYRALAHYTQQNDKKAEEDFRAALDANAYNVEAMYHWAEMLKSTNTQKALKLLDEAIDYHPNYVEARMLRADIRNFMGGKEIDVVREYEIIVEIQPYHHRAHYQKGKCHFNLEDYDNALASFNRAVSHCEENTVMYQMEIGETLLMLATHKGSADDAIDDYQSAREAFSAVLKQNPNAKNAYRGRGKSNLFLGEKQAALNDFEKGTALIQNENQRQEFYHLQGRVYYDLGKYEQAVAFFQKSNEISDQFIDNLYWLGMAYLAKDKVHQREAKVHFNRAIALTKIDKKHPYKARLYRQRGFLYAQEFDWKEAIKDYTVALELEPKNIVCLENRGLAYEEEGAFREAIQDYANIVRLDERNFRAYFLKGRSHNKLKDYIAAVSALSIAVQDTDAVAEYYHERGVSYFNLEKSSKAINDFLKAINMSGRQYESYTYIGRIRAKEGDYEEAISAFTMAMEGLPQDASLRRYRGDAHYAMETYGEARTDYETAIKLKLTDGKQMTVLRKAHCSRKLGDFTLAMDDYDQALVMNGNQKGDAYHGRGLVHLAKNRMNEAIEDFNNAEPLIDDETEKSILFYNRGTAHRENGNQNKACADYERSSVLGRIKATEALDKFCNK